MFRLCHCLANTAQWSRRGGIGIDVTWEMHVRFGRVPASSQKDLSISAAKQRLWGEVLAVLKISPNLRKQALRRLTECFRLEMSAFPYFLVLSREIAVSVMPFTICLTAHWFRSKEIFERFLFLFFFFLLSPFYSSHHLYCLFYHRACADTHTLLRNSLTQLSPFIDALHTNSYFLQARLPSPSPPHFFHFIRAFNGLRTSTGRTKLKTALGVSKRRDAIECTAAYQRTVGSGVNLWC